MCGGACGGGWPLGDSGGGGGGRSDGVWRRTHRIKNTHCHPCCPQVLWTVGRTEVGTPMGENQCRAPIGHSRQELAVDLQWLRALNLSYVWHESCKSRVSALYQAAQSYPILRQKHCTCHWEPCHQASLLEQGPIRVPGSLEHLVDSRSKVEVGSIRRGCRGSSSTQKGRKWEAPLPDGIAGLDQS